VGSAHPATFTRQTPDKIESEAFIRGRLWEAHTGPHPASHLQSQQHCSNAKEGNSSRASSEQKRSLRNGFPTLEAPEKLKTASWSPERIATGLDLSCQPRIWFGS
jgi:hypothetical protein